MLLEHQIVQLVYRAKEDLMFADDFVRQYMGFIMAETSKHLYRNPVMGEDEEVGIAMIAFHEAIMGYNRLRGSFLNYAALVIKNRLIDYYRSEKRHEGAISLDSPLNDESSSLHDVVASKRDYHKEELMRNATEQEIRELSKQMASFRVSITDVATNCPQQKRTINICAKAIEYAKAHPEVIEQLLRSKQLPLKQLSEGAKLPRKTLERHRKYLIAILLVYSNGYEIIRDHLKQVFECEVRD